MKTETINIPGKVTVIDPVKVDAWALMAASLASMVRERKSKERRWRDIQEMVKTSP